MSLPVFLCPCGARHARLYPNHYGIFWHRCKQCNTRLPTIGFLGRKELSRLCANPSCNRPLNPGIGEGTNVHIIILGSRSVGKTNYIIMALREFKHTFENMYRYTITFTDPVHKRNFEESLRRLDNGQELKMTPDIIPHAYNLRIKALRAWVPKLMYVYDAAGEVFNDSRHTRRQEYYKYTQGIIFVIDPCTITEYYRAHEMEIERIRDSIRPGSSDVMSTYTRMLSMFEASKGVRNEGRYPQPVAVVLTKADALKLEEEIGAPAAQSLMAQDPSKYITEEDAISTLVRDFLSAYGLDNFVRDLEAQFVDVKYFSCSALGRLPIQTNRQEFIPIRVLEPLRWLLTHAKAIKPM